MDQIINVRKTGDNLGRLCREQRITVKQIQNKLGLKSAQAVYRWFKGETLPSIEHFILLAVLLKKPIEEIIIFRDEKIFETLIPDMIRSTCEYNRMLK